MTDTPGLLDRAEGERNAMERLTLACLAHLPSAALFVMDLTGQCGTSVAAQWDIRARLKQQFPDKPWLDVFTKADLLGDLRERAALERASVERLTGEAAALPASADPAAEVGAGREQHDRNGASFLRKASQGVGDEGSSAKNLDEMGAEVQSMSSSSDLQQQHLSETGAGTLSKSGDTQRAGFTWGDRAETDEEKALEVAIALPQAVWVSSLTEIGLDDLKGLVLQMLASADVTRE